MLERIKGLLHFVMPGYFYLPISLWDIKSNKGVPDSTDLPDEDVDSDTLLLAL
jgi:hypothetical protein